MDPAGNEIAGEAERIERNGKDRLCRWIDTGGERETQQDSWMDPAGEKRNSSTATRSSKPGAGSHLETTQDGDAENYF